jgi:hypothetical protein
VAQGDHDEEERAERHVDDARRQHEQRLRAERCRGNARQRVQKAGAPVDVAPPRRHLADVRQERGDRHDRHRVLRPVLVDEDRQQQDRRAGADHATDRAGDDADDQRDEPGRHARASASEPRTLRMRRLKAA